MEQTFGRFVRQRRSSLGITLRGLASKLNLSPVYLSNIETDRKPAPTQEYLEKLAIELKLNRDEWEYLLDLAAKSKDQKGLRRPSGLHYGTGHRPSRPADSQGGRCYRMRSGGIY